MDSSSEELKFEDAAVSESEIEVAGAIDAFVSLEEIAPDAAWNDVLADAWGIPASDETSQSNGLRDLFRKLNLPWLR